MACGGDRKTQGSVRWAIFILAFASFGLMLTTTMQCTLFLVGKGKSERNFHQGFGLFFYAIYEDPDRSSMIGCVRYTEELRDNEDLFDADFKRARVFGFLSIVFHTTFLVMVVLVQLFVQHGVQTLWYLARIDILFALASQSSTFTAFFADICRDPDIGFQCVAGTTSLIAACNSLVLLVLGVLILSVSPPPHPHFQPWQELPQSESRNNTSNSHHRVDHQVASSEIQTKPSALVQITNEVPEPRTRMPPSSQKPSKKRAQLLPAQKQHRRIAISEQHPSRRVSTSSGREQHPSQEQQNVGMIRNIPTDDTIESAR